MSWGLRGFVTASAVVAATAAGCGPKTIEIRLPTPETPAASVILGTVEGAQFHFEAADLDDADRPAKLSVRTGDLPYLLLYQVPLSRLGLERGAGRASMNASGRLVIAGAETFVERAGAWRAVQINRLPVELAEARFSALPEDPLPTTCGRIVDMEIVSDSECALPDEPAPPEPPREPAPPDFGECPAGWTSRSITVADGFEVASYCEPPSCPAGTVPTSDGLCVQTTGECSGAFPDVPANVPDVKYVSESAAPGGDGSEQFPFVTIQQAISAVVTSSTWIAVAAGTYSESIVIERHPIVLAGLCEQTTIEGQILANQALFLRNLSISTPVDRVSLANVAPATLRNVRITTPRLGIEAYDDITAERLEIDAVDGGVIAMTPGRTLDVREAHIRTGGRALRSIEGTAYVQDVQVVGGSVADDPTTGVASFEADTTVVRTWVRGGGRGVRALGGSLDATDVFVEGLVQVVATGGNILSAGIAANEGAIVQAHRVTTLDSLAGFFFGECDAVVTDAVSSGILVHSGYHFRNGVVRAERLHASDYATAGAVIRGSAAVLEDVSFFDGRNTHGLGSGIILDSAGFNAEISRLLIRNVRGAGVLVDPLEDFAPDSVLNLQDVDIKGVSSIGIMAGRGIMFGEPYRDVRVGDQHVETDTTIRRVRIADVAENGLHMAANDLDISDVTITGSGDRSMLLAGSGLLLSRVDVTDMVQGRSAAAFFAEGTVQDLVISGIPPEGTWVCGEYPDVRPQHGIEAVSRSLNDGVAPSVTSLTFARVDIEGFPNGVLVDTFTEVAIEGRFADVEALIDDRVPGSTPLVSFGAATRVIDVCEVAIDRRAP